MGEREPQGGDVRGRYLAMLAAVLGWMFDGFEMGLHPLVARPALKELLPDPSGAGWWYAELTAAFLFGAAGGGLLFGWLGDRLGRKRALTLSVLTYAVFTGAGGFATSAWHLLVLRFVAALGMGGEWALGVALVMEVWPSRARPYLAAIIGLVGNLGYVIVALVNLVVLAFVAEPDKSWRPLMFLGVTPAVLALLIRLAVPESGKWVKAVAAAPAPSPRELLAPGMFGRTLVGVVLLGVALLGSWGVAMWIPQWAAELPGAAEVGGAKEKTQMCSAGGACVGAALASLAAWRFGRRPVYFALCLLALLVTAYLFQTPQTFGPFYRPQTFGPFFLAQVFLAGGVIGAFYGWAPLYLPELFPTRIRATGQGVAYNFGRIIAGVGTLVLTGQFMQSFQSDYPRSLSLTSLIYLVGLVAIWFAPETRGRPLPD
jgi:MFS family permease